MRTWTSSCCRVIAVSRWAVVARPSAARWINSAASRFTGPKRALPSRRYQLSQPVPQPVDYPTHSPVPREQTQTRTNWAQICASLRLLARVRAGVGLAQQGGGADQAGLTTEGGGQHPQAADEVQPA